MFNEMNYHAMTVQEGLKTDHLEYFPLKDFCGEDLLSHGFFFTNGNYGKQVVLVAERTNKDLVLVNMPQRAVEQFEKIANNEKMLHAVLTEHLAITDIHMINTKNGTTAAYTLSDV